MWARVLLSSLLLLRVAAVAAAARAEDLVDVVVVGAGPAGLAAAISAHLEGARVIVLEKRDPPYQREQILGLRAHGVDLLARLGVAPGRLPQAHGHRIISRAPSYQPPVALIATRDLETMLLERAKALGIEVRFGAGAEGVTIDPAGEVRVAVEGGLEPVVRGRYLVVADGPRSPLLEILGVERREERDVTRLMVGVFDRRGDGRVTEFHAPDGGRILRLGGRKMGVSVEVPAHLRFLSRGALLRFYRERAALAGVRGPLLLEPRETRVALGRAIVSADRLEGLGHRVFVIGEAARSTHAFSAAGVTWALDDARRFGRLYADHLASPRPDLPRVSRHFADETAEATNRLHDLARWYFPTQKLPFLPRAARIRERMAPEKPSYGFGGLRVPVTRR